MSRRYRVLGEEPAAPEPVDAPAPEAAPAEDAPRPKRPRRESILHFRVDSDTYASIQRYMTANNMNVSQAIRTLIVMGTDEAKTNPEAAFRAAAFREGLLMGLQVVKKHLNEGFRAAMQSIGEIRD